MRRSTNWLGWIIHTNITNVANIIINFLSTKRGHKADIGDKLWRQEWEVGVDRFHASMLLCWLTLLCRWCCLTWWHRAVWVKRVLAMAHRTAFRNVAGRGATKQLLLGVSSLRGAPSPSPLRLGLFVPSIEDGVLPPAALNLPPPKTTKTGPPNSQQLPLFLLPLPLLLPPVDDDDDDEGVEIFLRGRTKMPVFLS